MSILKLQNAGDEAVIQVTGCEVVEGQYGEQVKFEAGDDVLYLPRSSADRQLERIFAFNGGAADFYESLIGETLVFSRTPSNKPGGKPFWNINTLKPTNGAKKPASPKSPAPRTASSVDESSLPAELRPSQVEKEERAALSQKIGFDITQIEGTLSLYQSIAEWGARELPKVFNGGKDAVGMTPESLAACVNTIFINTAKK